VNQPAAIESGQIRDLKGRVEASPLEDRGGNGSGDCVREQPVE